MGNAPVQPAALEVQEPVLAIGGIHPRALVRAVGDTGALLEHHAILIGAHDAAAAHDHLPTGGHAPRRGKDVVPAVPLVDLGTLQGGVSLRAVEEQVIVTDGLRAVRAHGEDAQPALEADAALGIAMHHPGPAVVIPEGAGVNQALAGKHQHGLLPRSQGILRAHHVDALVRHAVVDVELPVMEADGRGPHALGVPGRAVVAVGDGLERVIHQLPVHQILAGEDGQAGGVVERGGGHVVGVAHADGVRIGVVAEDHRIAVGTVAVVGKPQLVHYSSTSCAAELAMPKLAVSRCHWS